jgi:ParB family transcriptional regulator, chromosome partitioning protein
MKLRMGGKKLRGKAASLAQRDKTTQMVGKLAGDEVKPDEFADIRRIPVSEMRPDPHQPRELQVTLEMLRNPQSVTDAKLKAKVESIIGLAETIIGIGQQTAIEVYTEGSRYNLVSGERRYWAARYAGLETLEAKVLPERPQRLRLKQYIENAQREGLTTKETMIALEDVVAECARVGSPVNTFSDLKKVTGMPNSSASRWWSILSGPQEVRDAIRDGKISGLMSAQAIARTGDASERKVLLEWLVRAEAEGRGTEVIQVASAKKAVVANQSKAQRGRPKKVFFGGTSNLNVACLVLKRVLGKEPSGIDREDVDAISTAFKAALRHLENEMAGVPSGTNGQK